MSLKSEECFSKYESHPVHEKKPLQNFGWWPLLGVSFSLTNSWLGISSSLVVGLSSGGPVLIIYGLIIGFIFTLICVISLSEFSSLLPHSSGPCFWTLKIYEHSTPVNLNKYQERCQPNDASTLEIYCSVSNISIQSRTHRNIGLAVGLINYFGSIFTTASICSSLSLTILGIHSMLHPNYLLKKWHTFLTYQVINIIITASNTWSKPLPSIFQIGLILSVLTFLLTFIISLVSRSDMNDIPWPSSTSIFGRFENKTGWSSSGTAFIVGLINPLWSYVGVDSATHMVDEVGHMRARVIVPRVMYTTVILGFVTALAYSIAMFYCITDTEKVVHSILPILQIYRQATGNRNLSIFFQTLCVLCGIVSGIASGTWQSRILWSIARDFSRIDKDMNKIRSVSILSLFSDIHPMTKVSVPSVLFSHILIVVIGCIFIGSSTAFNAIITASISLLLISYAVPSALVLWKGKQKFFKRIECELGDSGPLCSVKYNCSWFTYIPNFVCIVWALFCLVFFSFPYHVPVSGSSMNYVSVVYGAVFCIICIILCI